MRLILYRTTQLAAAAFGVTLLAGAVIGAVLLDQADGHTDPALIRMTITFPVLVFLGRVLAEMIGGALPMRRSRWYQHLWIAALTGVPVAAWSWLAINTNNWFFSGQGLLCGLALLLVAGLLAVAEHRLGPRPAAEPDAAPSRS
ncbi:hypothetical protein ACIA8O_38870 [Kitasatospora sp. NPDC051853]|uniref:hypothetical protein n=1 Tax=Kitasatospora sp. NPDC051853 TaxID=3364058 RepID=UPI0037A6491C